MSLLVSKRSRRRAADRVDPPVEDPREPLDQPSSGTFAEPGADLDGLSVSVPGEADGSALEPGFSSPPPDQELARLKRENFEEFVLYQRMADAVKTSLEHFLEPFQTAPEATYIFKTLMVNEFFSKFISMTNDFADQCCQSLVQIVRASSRIEAVRATPTPDLARRIREAAFKPQDLLLAQYVSLVKKIEVLAWNRKSGGPAGGGEPGSTPESGSGAAASASVSRDEQIRFQARLSQAKSHAYGKMVELIKTLAATPKPILDYTADKCFAADVVWELQRQQVARVQMELRPKIDNALETFGRVLVEVRGDFESAASQLAMNQQHERMHQTLDLMMEQRMAAKERSESRFKTALGVAVAAGLIIVGVIIWDLLRIL